MEPTNNNSIQGFTPEGSAIHLEAQNSIQQESFYKRYGITIEFVLFLILLSIPVIFANAYRRHFVIDWFIIFSAPAIVTYLIYHIIYLVEKSKERNYSRSFKGFVRITIWLSLFLYIFIISIGDIGRQ